MLLPPNVNPNSLEQQFPKWTKIWWGEKSENQLKLQPLTQMHFDPIINTAYASNPIYTYILSGIALLVLFIACVNFTTLTLGRQATRAREVGLRKVVGAGRMQIAKQFIGESLLLIIIACIAGIAIAELALPTFNNLSYQSLALTDRPQFHNTRISHSSNQPRRHHSRRLSRLCAIPPSADPDHNEPVASQNGQSFW